jgi:hypothetical protein
MGRMSNTQRIIARNNAAREINRLLRQGKEVPPWLLARAGWKRRIAREGI